MSMNDPLSNAMSKILNNERIARKECEIKPVSTVIKKVLDIMKDNHYIGEYKEVKDSKGNYLALNLLSNINKCGVIKPRFPVALQGYEKYEKRYLPAKDFGILIVSTPQGMMTHVEAKTKKLGGKLIAYVY
jgi:small subunit ribosomal protein S8